MTLIELVNHTHFGIFASVCREFKLTDRDIESFKPVFDIIKTMEPIHSKMRIKVSRHISNIDGKMYFDVFGVDGQKFTEEDADLHTNLSASDREAFLNTEITCSLGHCDWAKFIGMKIETDGVPADQALAACILEMTKYGMTPEAIQQDIDYIHALSKKVKSGEMPTCTMEELHAKMLAKFPMLFPGVRNE